MKETITYRSTLTTNQHTNDADYKTSINELLWLPKLESKFLWCGRRWKDIGREYKERGEMGKKGCFTEVGLGLHVYLNHS